MINTFSTLEVVTPEQLDTVTGGGIGTTIGSMFGEKGAKWGGFADSIIGMIGKGGGLGSLFGGGKSGGGQPSGGQPSGGQPSGGDTGGGES
jgi:hypothetical protein